MLQDFMTILSGLAGGIPLVLLHFGTVLGLLLAGVVLYAAVTPFHERSLIEAGNAAAGTVMAGAIIGMAIPLAILVATSPWIVDIIAWGLVSVLLQFIAVGIVSLLLHGMRARIEANNIAAAMVLAAAQIAVGILNAAVMVPN
jgi:putative membrane protein